jgi:hypothetical protein
MADEPPTNLRSLQARLRNYSRQTDQVPQRVHRLVGVLVVGQLLTDSGIGVVKGGSNLEVRLGLASTRASSDLDVLRTRTIDEFRNELEAALDGGWEGFGGRVVDRGGIPAPVPDGYRPHRFDVKLEYGGQPFQTVTLWKSVWRRSVASTRLTPSSVTTGWPSSMPSAFHGLPRFTPSRCISRLRRNCTLAQHLMPRAGATIVPTTLSICNSLRESTVEH